MDNRFNKPLTDREIEQLKLKALTNVNICYAERRAFPKTDATIQATECRHGSVSGQATTERCINTSSTV
jgi:hypothetical protein